MLDINVLKSEERAIFALRGLYKQYGYQPFKMSKFEEYDLYVRNKDFLVSDRVITFNDTDGRLLALKPDVTLSIIKNTKKSPYDKQKVCYNETVYRVSGATGQYKEIMQTGIECIGDIDMSDAFEVVELAAKSLSLISPDYVLDISHMGIVTAFLAEAQGGKEFNKRITSLIAEKNSHEIVSLCEEQGISKSAAAKLSALAGMYGKREKVIESLAPLCESEEAKAALAEMKALSEYFSARGIGDSVRFDFSVVNNMKYYNGIVFKGFLSGISEGVLAGGEYDNLLAAMKLSSRGIGFALYLDRLSELDIQADEYDVDILLLYDAGTPSADLASQKDKYIALGKTVYAATCAPEKIRYRELVRVK